MILTEIHCAVELYFEVMHECDLKKLDRIFHPASSLFAVQDGTLILRPFEVYRAEIAKRTSPSASGQPRIDSVITIDLLASDTALAKVRVQINDKVFVDYLNLLKIDGRWMIVAKIYSQVETVPT